MAKFKVGDIVLVPFPYSDLKGQKLRPAMVIASSEYVVSVAHVAVRFTTESR